MSDPGAGSGTIRGWIGVNDTVMGGRSTSRMIRTPAGNLVFEGTLSLEGGGGFASVRCTTHPHLAGYRALAIQVRGDGRSYEIRLRTTTDRDGIAYRVLFSTSPGEWRSLEIPFTLFEPVFRGRPVPEAGPLDPAAVVQIGFLLADRKPGPFHLEVNRLDPVP